MVKKQEPEKPVGDLDAGDADLWEKVTRSAEPLTRGRNRAPRREAPAAEQPPAETKVTRSKKKTAPAPRAETPPPQPAPPPLGGFDRREAKGLGAGRIDLDARIDLHGMRQGEAHAALAAFIQHSRARGHRHVLVITGKGAPRLSRDAEPSFGQTGEATGVLRRAVPRWLDEPEFREWVVSFTRASPRHGGEGALYVRLRRSRQTVKE